MGRYSTGALTTGEAQRIELSLFLKKGFIKKNHSESGTISWSDGNKIGFESVYNENFRYLRLNYKLTDRYSGEESHKDYTIELESIPSNLGKGEVIYFVCPETGRRARVLYRCYGSHIWKSRTAYQHRIYYNSQISSKIGYHSSKSWDISNILEKCYQRRKRKYYKGKETRLSQRIRLLEKKKEYHDMEWDAIFLKYLYRF